MTYGNGMTPPEGGIVDAPDPETVDLPSDIHPLDEDEIRSILAYEVTQAEEIGQNTVQSEQETALNYYYGRPFGNEVEGRSQVVLADVAETIDWVMPSLMRMFTGGPTVVRFDPNDLNNVDEARMKTDWCNFTFMRKLNGFNILHDLFKTCLIEKRSFVSVYADEYSEPTWQTYTGLDEVMLHMLVADGTATIVELKPGKPRDLPPTPVMDPSTGQPVVDPNTGQPAMQPNREQTFDVVVKMMQTEPKVCVETFPTEEFLISRRYPRIDNRCPFTARKIKRTISELLALGYDPNKVHSLTSEDPRTSHPLGRIRFFDEDPAGNVAEDSNREGAAREVWVLEAYVRLDADGDGFTELHRIVAGGGANGCGEILEDKRVDEVGYASLCPYPMPGKFWGRSLADLVLDLQLIRSTLLRQMLDHQYLTINPRTVVLSGEVETDDLLISRPGGLIREYTPNAVRPFEMSPLGPQPFSLLEYLHEERENRAGSTRYNQGLDASSLNQTARGINAIMGAAQARIELIARIFAEDLKRLFKLLVRVLATSGIKKEVIQLEGKWVEFDPSTWKADLSCTVQVGLGVGQAQERLQNLQQIIGLQQAAMQAGLAPTMVKPKHFYAAVQQMTQAMGYAADGMFFDDPHEWVPPPPPPTPEQVQAQADAAKTQSDTEINRSRVVLESAQAKDDVQLKMLEIASREKIEQEKIASQERIAMAKIKMEMKTAAADRAAAAAQPAGGPA